MIAATISIDVEEETQLYDEQHSRTDYNNFLVYQSYLLQLHSVCIASVVTELGNLKLGILEGKKRRSR